jgi:FMN phosphatase YigB (HAD superfamily)
VWLLPRVRWDVGSGSFSFVLFDLGGVLVRLSGVARLQQMAGIETEEGVWRRWLSCPWIRRFERGLCTPQEFADGFVSSWGLRVGAKEFLDFFCSFPEALFPGAVELVSECRALMPVGCLSNSNVLHWELMGKGWGLAKLFDVTFLSHELGLIKPDRDVFEHVICYLGVPARSVVFLDDNDVNVSQARAAGMVAWRARGASEARTVLSHLGVLAASRQ